MLRSLGQFTFGIGLDSDTMMPDPSNQITVKEEPGDIDDDETLSLSFPTPTGQGNQSHWHTNTPQLAVNNISNTTSSNYINVQTPQSTRQFSRPGQENQLLYKPVWLDQAILATNMANICHQQINTTTTTPQFNNNVQQQCSLSSNIHHINSIQHHPVTTTTSTLNHTAVKQRSSSFVPNIDTLFNTTLAKSLLQGSLAMSDSQGGRGVNAPPGQSCQFTTPDTRQSNGFTIKTSSNKIHGKRVWDKKHYCLYCGRPYSKIWRHMLQKHAVETSVARALSFRCNSKERKDLIAQMRKKGDFQHNLEVLRNKEGVIIPTRCPSSDTAPSSMLPCEFCLGFFKHSQLWRHKKTCQRKLTDDNSPPVSPSPPPLPHPPVPDPPPATEDPPPDEGPGVIGESFRHHILSRMSNDEVSAAARNDTLILQFGQKLFEKYGHDEHMYAFISKKIREVSRFLIDIRKLSQISAAVVQ